MPVLQPDVSEMTDFQASVPNTYVAEIKKVDAVEAKKENEKTGKKTKGIQPEFEFRAPRLADKEERTVSRRAWLAIDGKGTFNFDQLLRCCGFKELADEMKARPGQVPFDTDILIGKRVGVVITTQVYEGKQSDQIDSFLPA
jgi:hypothetical protein